MSAKKDLRNVQEGTSMASKRRAGKIAKRVARKAYKGALRMPKRKLAKVYATKCGQSAFRAAKKKRR